MHDDMQPDTLNPAPAGAQQGHEGAMARADLYKLANYSLKLFKKLDDSAQLEGWVQAKITKAADYIASVYHYMEYEMKFNEYGEHLSNAEVMSESQKQVIKNKLMEAKQKMAELKKIQADKITGKKVAEGVLSGGERPCAECGGSGMVYEEPKAVPDHVKSKVDKYKRLTKAMHAANKRLDKNNNGIPDNLENDQEVGEDQGSLKKAGDSYKTSAGGTVTKTATGIRHERDPSSYDDGGDSEDKSGKGKKSHAKAMSAAEKKDRAPKLKQSKSGTWGMKDGEKFDTRKKEKAVDETFGQGVYAEGNEPKDKPKKGEKVGKEGNAFGNAVRKAKADGVQKGEKITVGGKEYPVKEGLKGKQHKLDVDDDGDIEADDLADLRAGKKAKKVKEGICSTCHEDPCDCKKVDESEKKTMSRAAKGNEKYGKDGMKALAKAGKAGASEKKMDAIRDKHDKYSESWKLKAKALKENLESMVPDQDLELDEEQQQAQAGLQALLDYAKQNDPQGLAQAMQQGGEGITKYFTSLADKMTAGGTGATMGAEPTQQTAQQPTQQPTAQPQGTPATEPPEAKPVAESAEFNRIRALAGL